MSYNSRLVTGAKLKAIVEIADEISNGCQGVADAVCDYESAAELTGQERTDAREEAREAAMTALGDLLADAARLREIYAKIDESFEDSR